MMARVFFKTFPFMTRTNGGFWFTVRQVCRRLVFDGIDGLRRYVSLFADRKARIAGQGNLALPTHISSLAESVWESVDNEHARWLQQARTKYGYIFFVPDYVGHSAGIVCLYALCSFLGRLGYPAYLSYYPHEARVPPPLVLPSIPLRKARTMSRFGYTVVYPETVTGNPIGGPHVARWVLNRPGLLGGEEVYDERELVFCYSNIYLPYIRNRVAGKLMMPTLDETIFYHDDKVQNRNLECYYVGKSSFKEGYFDKNKVFQITRVSPDKKELGKLFRVSRMLYSFDNITALVGEALACGCPVTIIPDGTIRWEDLELGEIGTDGVFWGLGGAGQKEIDVKKVQERYKRAKSEFREQLIEFIYITQKQFS
jgi:O-antigen biosynthesis protein